MSDCYPQARADPEIERGGTHRVGAAMRRAHAQFCLRPYITGDEATHSVLRGCGGMLPQLKFKSSSETVGNHGDHAKIMATGRFIVWSFLGAPSLLNQPLYMRHCHRIVLWELQI